MTDKTDKFLDLASWFDPLAALGYFGNYNTVEYEGLDTDCKKREKELKAQGIKCRTEFTGDGWRVVSSR